jgi:hypothetical protein
MCLSKRAEHENIHTFLGIGIDQEPYSAPANLYLYWGSTVNKRFTGGLARMYVWLIFICNFARMCMHVWSYVRARRGLRVLFQACMHGRVCVVCIQRACTNKHVWIPICIFYVHIEFCLHVCMLLWRHAYMMICRYTFDTRLTTVLHACMHKVMLLHSFLSSSGIWLHMVYWRYICAISCPDSIGLHLAYARSFQMGNTHTHIHIHIYICVCAYIHTYINICTGSGEHVRHLFKLGSIQGGEYRDPKFLGSLTGMCPYWHVTQQWARLFGQYIYVCVCVYICVCMYVCMT